MAIKISGSTIIDDSRVVVNADKIGIGAASPNFDLEILSGTATGIAVSATSTQSTDTNLALRVFNNSATENFKVSYRGRVDATEYHGVFKGTIDSGVIIDTAANANKIQIHHNGTNVLYNIPFLTASQSDDSYQDLYYDNSDSLQYNPNTGRLRINSSDGLDALTIRTNANTISRGLAFQNSGDAYVGYVGMVDAGNNTADMVFGVDDATNSDVDLVEERMRITRTGNVGINKTNPTHKLEILNGSDSSNILMVFGADTTTEYASMGVSGGNAIITGGGGGSTSTGIVFQTSLSGTEGEKVRIDSNGDVGISVNNPTEKLHVSGNIRLTGNFYQSVPTDFWNQNTTFIELNDIGNLTHMGGYETNLTSNGYRDTNGQWVSYAANSNTGAAQIGLKPQGTIVFRTDASKANGTAHNPTTRLSIESDGEVRIADGGKLTINSNPAATYGVSEVLRVDDSNSTGDRALQIFEYQHSGARWFSFNQNLHVTTNGSAYTYTQGNYGGSNMIQMDSGTLRIYANAQVTGGSQDNITPSEKLRITSAGSVNIGGDYSQTGKKLKVTGDAEVDGTLTATSFSGPLTGSASKINVTTETSDTTCFPVFVETHNTTSQDPHTSTSLEYNSSSKILISQIFQTSNGNATNVASRDKYRLWNSNAYAIGFDNAMSFGGLNNYATTFQMNNQSNRGWVFLDNAHTDAQGSMALTTDGKMTVAHSLRIGFGESDTTTPGASHLLDVGGNVQIGSLSTADAELVIGRDNSGNRNAYIDFIGDDTYDDYGLRIIRKNSGSDTDSEIAHRGTGSLIISTSEAASVKLATQGTEKLIVDSNGLTTLKNFNGTGLRLEGSGSNYQGIQLKVTDASASQTRNVFIDAVNETGAAVANQVGAVQADGGSAWIWQTQATGNRTDRRQERLRINPDGMLLPGGTAQDIGSTSQRWRVGYFNTVNATTITGTLSAGADTQVIFNDGGSALAGDSGLTYIKGSDKLVVAGQVNTPTLFLDELANSVEKITGTAGHLDLYADSSIRLYESDNDRLGITFDVNQTSTDRDVRMYFLGDSDTYLHSPANDTLGFTIGGTERLRLQTDALNLKTDVRYGSNTSLVLTSHVYVRGTGYNNNNGRVCTINGVDQITGGNTTNRGLHLITYDATDSLTLKTGIIAVGIARSTYDTHISGTNSNNLATAIGDMDRTTIGVLCSYDAFTDGLTDNLRTAAQKVGLFKLAGMGSGTQTRQPYAAIFRGTSDDTNAEVNDAIEVIQSDDADAPSANISTFITCRGDGENAAITGANSVSALVAPAAGYESPLLQGKSSTNSASTLTIGAGVHLLPSGSASNNSDANGVDLGGGSNYLRQIYVRQLNADSIVGAVTGAASLVTLSAASANSSHFLAMSESSSGNEEMRVDSLLTFNPSTNKFGINTGTPEAILDVGGVVDGNVQAIMTRGNDTNFQLQFRNERSSNNAYTTAGMFGLFRNDVDIVGMQFERGSGTGPGQLSITTAGSEKLLIENDGNIVSRINAGVVSLIDTRNVSNAGTKLAFFGANRYDTNEEFASIKGQLVSNNGGAGNKQGGRLLFTTGVNSNEFVIDQNGNIGLNVTPAASGGAGTLYGTVDHFLVIGDNDTGIAQDGDGQFEIWANNQEIVNFNNTQITPTKNIIPSSDSSLDIGSNGVRFANGYFDNIIATNITGDVTGTASQLAMTNQSSDTTCFPVFVRESGSANLTPHSNTSLTFNASTAELGASVLRATGGTVVNTTGSETSPTNVALLIENNDYIYTNDGTSSKRRLIGKSKSGSTEIIEIGQTGTALIDEIKMIPGNGGFFSVNTGNTEDRFVVDSSGNVTIGGAAGTAEGRLDVFHSALGNTAGNETTMAVFGTVTGNDTKLLIQNVRNSNGTDWTTTSTRIQRRVDVTDHAYLDFGVNGGDGAYILRTNSDFIPSTNGSKDLGSSSNRWGTIYANTINGTITGTITDASSADQIKTINRNGTNSTHYLTFVDSNNSGSTSENLYTDNHIYYNPSSNILNVGSRVVSGNGSGSVAMTINDGYGNANLAFNHEAGIPDVNGSSGRIECNVDGTTAQMMFELWDSVTAGSATGGAATNIKLRLTTGAVQVYQDLMPDTDSSKDIGSNTVRFANGYFDNIFASNINGSGTITDVAVDQTGRTCGDILTVTGTNTKTINIPSASNAYGAKYIGSSVSGTFCDGDVWYDTSSGSSGDAAFPSGTRMIFQQTNAPTGWTKDTSSVNQRALRVVSGTAGSGGEVNFTTAFASNRATSGGAVQNHTLTTAQIPSHFHQIFNSNSNAGSHPNQSNINANSYVARGTGAVNHNEGYNMRNAGNNATNGKTSNVGSGSGHNHGFTNPTVNLAVLYLDVIICQKD